MEKSNKKLILIGVVFLIAFFVPFSLVRVSNAVQESLLMLNDYAREHVLLCILPALFIAGAIVVFLNQQAIIKYLGPKAKKWIAYTVASVSGAILAVCSCTILPLFKGIYKRGAGLGPAVAFLYSGPAINILAIILSYKVFGWQLGVARLTFSLIFAVIIGFVMERLFAKEEAERAEEDHFFSTTTEDSFPIKRVVLLIGSLIGLLVFLNWAPSNGANRGWDFIYSYKYWLSGIFAIIALYTIIRWFRGEPFKEWLGATRDLALQIFPLLLGGVLIAGLLLGRPGFEGLIPSQWVSKLVGGDSLLATFFASIAGAFMYFATLTEIPIVEGLMGAGMGNGPALALLLAGPSLSLPAMLVIGKELGWEKTVVYVALVVGFSTLAGIIFSMVI